MPSSAVDSAAAPVALVTGGARRVGRSIALLLAERGYDVAITYRTSQLEAAELVRKVEELGRRAVAIKANFFEPEQAVATVRRAIGDDLRRLDVLVNNASAYGPSGIFDVSLEQMRQYWAIHMEAPLLLCRELANLLRADEGGTVINLTDIQADRPRPMFAAYGMSKAALANLTLSLARELAPKVTANAIAPGVVEWPDDLPEQAKDQYLSRVPLEREGSPQDVAELVYFLATTGRYITGQTIRLDGGRSTR